MIKLLIGFFLVLHYFAISIGNICNATMELSNSRGRCVCLHLTVATGRTVNPAYVTEAPAALL